MGALAGDPKFREAAERPLFAVHAANEKVGGGCSRRCKDVGGALAQPPGDGAMMPASCLLLPPCAQPDVRPLRMRRHARRRR